LAERDERAITKETWTGTGRPPTLIHKQDPDGKDGSILGDSGRAEEEGTPTTWRMQNTIQMQTRRSERTDSRPESFRTLPTEKPNRSTSLKGLVQDQ
jgi:hypothetical protein